MRDSGGPHGPSRWRALAAAAVVVVLAGCGTSSGPDDAAGTGRDPAATDLTVFAAASLTEVFTELGVRYERAHPGSEVSFSFAGSQSLVAQVQQGAPADLLATADEASAAAVRSELASEPVVLARNRLAIATEKGNPLGLTRLADLSRSDVTLVLAAPTVPVGTASRAALSAAGVVVSPVSLELDVKAVLQKVRLGEADAGLVYATDVVAAGDDVTGIDLPGVTNSYPAAPVVGADHPAAARAFLALAGSPEGRAVFARAGFLSP